MNELVYQARFAYSRFADDRHHLAKPTAGKVLHAVELLQIELTPNKSREAASSGDLQASSHRAGAGHFVELHRLG